MNSKITPYIYILFFWSLSNGIFAQELTLQIIGKDSLETAIINQLDFKKKHLNRISIDKEITAVQNTLKSLGYFTNVLEDILQVESDIIASFLLGTKTDSVQVFVSNEIQELFPNINSIQKDTITLKPNEIESFMKSVMKDFDQNGRSFTEIKLIDQKIQKNLLITNLFIDASDERTINKIIVKGYDNFPRSYVKKYFRLNEDVVFSKDQLQEISSKTKALGFVEEIKPPEVLFKQDSTILYLFLKRVRTSSVDGIINFASKEDDSGILINGNVDLKLNNALNTGEQFELFWNRVKEGNSEFRIGTTIPYIFNSSISLDARFNIYRQDSTFLNTTFNSRLIYQLNSKSSTFITYRSETSDYLLDEIGMNLETYTSNFIGIGYEYSQLSKSNLFNNSFMFNASTDFGSRESNTTKEDQIRISFETSLNIPITTKAYINLKNRTALLESENYLTNELFRIGGASSIRGFIEQSIFTNRFSYINVEYRYLTSSTSFLHTITDFGLYQNLIENRTESLIGAGFGYLFRIDNNRVNLGYAIGIDQNNGIDLNNSQLLIKWTSIF